MQMVRIEHKFSIKGYKLMEEGKRDELRYGTAGKGPHGVVVM